MLLLLLLLLSTKFKTHKNFEIIQTTKIYTRGDFNVYSIENVVAIIRNHLLLKITLLLLLEIPFIIENDVITIIRNHSLLKITLLLLLEIPIHYYK